MSGRRPAICSLPNQRRVFDLPRQCQECGCPVRSSAGLGQCGNCHGLRDGAQTSGLRTVVPTWASAMRRPHRSRARALISSSLSEVFAPATWRRMNGCSLHSRTHLRRSGTVFLCAPAAARCLRCTRPPGHNSGTSILLCRSKPWSRCSAWPAVPWLVTRRRSWPRPAEDHPG